jgi:ribosomal protein S27AE
MCDSKVRRRNKMSEEFRCECGERFKIDPNSISVTCINCGKQYEVARRYSKEGTSHIPIEILNVDDPESVDDDKKCPTCGAEIGEFLYDFCDGMELRCGKCKNEKGKLRKGTPIIDIKEIENFTYKIYGEDKDEC